MNKVRSIFEAFKSKIISKLNKIELNPVAVLIGLWIALMALWLLLLGVCVSVIVVVLKLFGVL